MPKVFDVGRVCVKLAGKEAGKMCVVVDIVDERFVIVTGPKNLTGVKRRRTNVKHLEPTEYRVEISKGASDEEVTKAIEAAGLVDIMKKGVQPKLFMVPTVKVTK
ncbi:50S ribosomal protein L14e [Caldivirga maquilingensis]|uniref:Large ribosomal subunit protein eL14 n=1 Tax=Caldivirga maquilingensis (strain ATCC 700844 / DSM 13496 / JCM 10307 / IC-167) TaxID=397948 RepID=A8MA75_CALMQ|nr:50S ribosomal protein L14e [Caldivirga maquilingensis]ABW01007.1 ribosomal protein L14E [Caldivirga maquilingensis IC-167]